MTGFTPNPSTTSAREILSALPTDREQLLAINAQCAFLVQQLTSALGHLDAKNPCTAKRVVEHALASIGKMPTNRVKRARS